MPLLRSLTVQILMLWQGRSQKEVAAKAGFQESRLSGMLRRGLNDELYERLLAALAPRPGQVAVVTAFLDALAATEEEGELTAEERDAVELGVLEGARHLRAAFTEAALYSREAPLFEDYPRPEEVEPARWQAGVLFSLLRELPGRHQLAVVRVARQFQSWALAERCCEESVAAASGDLERAAHLAGLAREIAARVGGPEGWCRAVQGWVAGHGANVLRVKGELPAARAGIEEAQRLWRDGSDPGRVLDPGRLLDLEASLCRDERRFPEALALLDEARGLSRQPARILIKKGFTLEVLGDYERAVATLLEAEPLLDRDAEPRLWYMQRFNLAVNATHLGHYSRATDLVREVRQLAVERGDENELIRVTWLDGRIAAGLGRREEALDLLAQARRRFATRGMGYDVALALLEEAALRLDSGEAAEVKALAGPLQEVFAGKGVHREALATLRLFQEAVENGEATAALARRLLTYLFRARHDPGIQFTAP